MSDEIAPYLRPQYEQEKEVLKDFKLAKTMTRISLAMGVLAELLSIESSSPTGMAIGALAISVAGLGIRRTSSSTAIHEQTISEIENFSWLEQQFQSDQ